MADGEAPVPTGRTASQGVGITEAEDPALAPRGAPDTPLLMGNGAHMGRGRPECERHAAMVALAARIAQAVAAEDFALATRILAEAWRLATAGGEEA